MRTLPPSPNSIPTTRPISAISNGPTGRSAGTVRFAFTIRADRFLRNMVRAIVGTLVDVGRGRYTVEQFRDIVASRDLSRSSAGAPAQGLFLSDVLYPPEVFVRETRLPALRYFSSVEK